MEKYGEDNSPELKSLIEDRVFTLEQMYGFVDVLALKHTENHHVKDKIRQQLQVLRDNGIIEFLERDRIF